MTVSRRALLLALLFAGALLPASLVGQEAKTEVKAEAKAEAKPNDAVVPVPKEGGWMMRHENFNKRVKEGKVDLLLIGDSITQGWEGAGKKVWEEFYAKRNAVNLGIGGDRTQHVLWRLDHGNIDGIKPKAAVLMIGTNNSGSNSSEQIAEGVKAIVDKLKTKLPETKILVLAVFPRGANKDDPRRKVNTAANEIIAKLADDKQVFFLDIGPKFVAEDGTLSKEIMPDLLHLNEKSYRIWADSIEGKLAQLMGEKS
ncbi:multifunctional acyl-CoA thioesterase I and protease I and lysophospholipase L1 [Anatilimnocola aggregata]|uniref:Multifunctional acyl-CoA thioesterase I and protease I and lysophospholipase L1 n=1 Tax=Anatilimnocola aggregata TaxID=2528021 RepID=A0A517Y7B4_9BACT|nr:platelet-activating factor acetylhydrolase IB subunit [Anatilimnocola aggregata]QDU26128.1 multifunctional acyl-CoA thioesterase I and protease I and lysophospholipase L1 [Anatilimnocola aggregata]